MSFAKFSLVCCYSRNLLFVFFFSLEFSICQPSSWFNSIGRTFAINAVSATLLVNHLIFSAVRILLYTCRYLVTHKTEVGSHAAPCRRKLQIRLYP